MARTLLTATVAPGQYPAAGVAATEAASDVANGNMFVSTGKELLVARNTDVSTHHVTVNSVADDKGRTGDITSEAIAAGAIRVYGPFAKSYWAQSNGNINCSADDATVKFTVIQLP